MPAIDIHLDGDNCWPDLSTKKVIEGVALSIAGLPHGMQSGDPSVTLRIDLSNGTVVLQQTSLALFLQAADLLRIRYGDPRNTKP